MDTIEHNGHTVTAEFGDSTSSEYTANYLGYLIRITLNGWGQNPWDDMDGLAPTLTHYQHRHDLGNDNVESEIIDKLTMEYVEANYVTIAGELDDIKGDKDHVQLKLMELYWAAYDESLITQLMYSEAFPNGREPSERTQLIRKHKAWTAWMAEGIDELYDAYAEYITETLARLYSFGRAVGLDCALYTSTGHSQGDQSTVLVVLTDDWKKNMAYDECAPVVDVPIGAPEYARAKAKVYMDEAERIYTGWAWGDIYDFECSHTADYLWTEDAGYSQFYGNDHADSGLLKSACDLIDQRLEQLTAMQLKSPLLSMDGLHSLLMDEGAERLEEVCHYQRGLYADAPTYQQVVDYCISLSK